MRYDINFRVDKSNPVESTLGVEHLKRNAAIDLGRSIISVIGFEEIHNLEDSFVNYRTELIALSIKQWTELIRIIKLHAHKGWSELVLKEVFNNCLNQ